MSMEVVYFPPDVEPVNEDGSAPRFFDHLKLDMIVGMEEARAVIGTAFMDAMATLAQDAPTQPTAPVEAR